VRQKKKNTKNTNRWLSVRGKRYLWGKTTLGLTTMGKENRNVKRKGRWAPREGHKFKPLSGFQSLDKEIKENKSNHNLVPSGGVAV